MINSKHSVNNKNHQQVVLDNQLLFNPRLAVSRKTNNHSYLLINNNDAHVYIFSFSSNTTTNGIMTGTGTTIAKYHRQEVFHRVVGLVQRRKIQAYSVDQFHNLNQRVCLEPNLQQVHMLSMMVVSMLGIVIEVTNNMNPISSKWKVGIAKKTMKNISSKWNSSDQQKMKTLICMNHFSETISVEEVERTVTSLCNRCQTLKSKVMWNCLMSEDRESVNKSQNIVQEIMEQPTVSIRMADVKINAITRIARVIFLLNMIVSLIVKDGKMQLNAIHYLNNMLFSNGPELLSGNFWIRCHDSFE